MSDFDNELSKAQEERLAILMEEMGEAIQIAGKILRHGYFSCNPHDEKSVINRAMLERELGDVKCAIQMLEDAGDVLYMQITQRMKEKPGKMKPCLHHQ